MGQIMSLISRTVGGFSLLSQDWVCNVLAPEERRECSNPSDRWCFTSARTANRTYIAAIETEDVHSYGPA